LFRSHRRERFETPNAAQAAAATRSRPAADLHGSSPSRRLDRHEPGRPTSGETNRKRSTRDRPSGRSALAPCAPDRASGTSTQTAEAETAEAEAQAAEAATCAAGCSASASATACPNAPASASATACPYAPASASATACPYAPAFASGATSAGAARPLPAACPAGAEAASPDRQHGGRSLERRQLSGGTHVLPVRSPNPETCVG
jgi:hypothetical protein